MDAINAATGEVVFSFSSQEEFDRWYDHHSEYRMPRDESEIRPDLRNEYLKTFPSSLYVVRDEA